MYIGECRLNKSDKIGFKISIGNAFNRMRGFWKHEEGTVKDNLTGVLGMKNVIVKIRNSMAHLDNRMDTAIK